MNSKYQIYFILRKAENRIMKSKADIKKKKKNSAIPWQPSG